jgi:NADH-dependent peroxiredoxin subunit F
MTYDTIIIGGGPAGCAAAVYSARKQLTTLLITSEFGGQSVVSDDVQNWIGTPHISGADLAKSLKTHVKSYEGPFLSVSEGEKVASITGKAPSFTITTESGKVFEARSVLVTAGSARRRLEAPGADRLEHKGLTYCASCDGPMFSDMPVAVIGGGNAALESVLQLTAYCSHVTLIHRSEHFRADEITVEKVQNHPKVTIVTNAEITEVHGEMFVDGISYKNKLTGEITHLDVSGIFVEIGQIANTSFIGEIVEKDEYGKIIIDPWTQKTSAEGIWAAGDITNIRYHQNNIAAGDAVKAIEDLYQWVKHLS